LLAFLGGLLGGLGSGLATVVSMAMSTLMFGLPRHRHGCGAGWRDAAAMDAGTQRQAVESAKL
jgi:hypothetical protein